MTILGITAGIVLMAIAYIAAKEKRMWNAALHRYEVEGERIKEIEAAGKRMREQDDFLYGYFREKKQPLRKACGLFSDAEAQELLW